MNYKYQLTCINIVWHFTAYVTASTARGVQGADRLEVGWPLVGGRGEDACLGLPKQRCTVGDGLVIGIFSYMCVHDRPPNVRAISVA